MRRFPVTPIIMIILALVGCGNTAEVTERVEMPDIGGLTAEETSDAEETSAGEELSLTDASVVDFTEEEVFAASEGEQLIVSRQDSGEEGMIRLRILGYLDGMLSIELFNGSSTEWEYGNEFHIGMMDQGNWRVLEWPEGMAWTEELHSLQTEEVKTITLDLNGLAELEEGEYKLYFNGLEAEFCLTGGSF